MDSYRVKRCKRERERERLSHTTESLTPAFVRITSPMTPAEAQHRGFLEQSVIMFWQLNPCLYTWSVTCETFPVCATSVALLCVLAVTGVVVLV